MKKIFYTLTSFVIFITCLSFQSKAQTQTQQQTQTTTEIPKGKLVLVEIYEVPLYPGKGIYVHWGNSRVDYTAFKSFQAENHDENGEMILRVIQDLESRGFKIEHMTSGLAENGMITKIFMRNI